MVTNRGDLDCKVAFELVELIIVNCDRRSLLQCSLVCRSWLHSCRPRLFKIVEIDTSLSALRFTSLLEGKYATIPQYIEDLTLKLDIIQRRQFGLAKPIGEGEPENLSFEGVINLIAIRLQCKIPLLRRLGVVFRGTRMLPRVKIVRETSYISRFASTFGHITELDLHLPAEDKAALIQFTCSFPHLKVLKARCGVVDDREGEEDLEVVQRQAPDWTLPSSLKSLDLSRGLSADLNTDGLNHYYRWLNLQRPLRLEQLSIYKIEIHARSSDPDIQPYLNKCRELRFLHLGLDTWCVVTTGLGSVRPYDLSALEQLEQLVITIRNVVQDDPDIELVDCTRMMLATLTSPRLQRIIFNVSGSGYRTLEEQWDAIDGLLGSDKFKEVMVELVVPFSDLTTGDETSEEDLLRAKRIFSRCNTQGRISVVRAPFVVRTRGWHEEGTSEEEDDSEEISWVCDRFFQTRF
ncbi:hypothetical protein PM082_019744 [Marasmius tenuissimus]|nr:hypothetical protein PM082_019744 [Marasmius tenuissimus]